VSDPRAAALADAVRPPPILHSRFVLSMNVSLSHLQCSHAAARTTVRRLPEGCAKGSPVAREQGRGGAAGGAGPWRRRRLPPPAGAHRP
jgi:hypothetical protein